MKGSCVVLVAMLWLSELKYAYLFGASTMELGPPENSDELPSYRRTVKASYLIGT